MRQATLFSSRPSVEHLRASAASVELNLTPLVARCFHEKDARKIHWESGSNQQILLPLVSLGGVVVTMNLISAEMIPSMAAK